MFYEPGKTPHNLPRDPFKACVTPRPIGWISTRCPTTGTDNLAPYSQFNNLTFDPPYVMFAANQTLAGTRKDSARNAETSGVFGWSVATWDLREAVNASAENVAPDVDEFERCGLAKLPGRTVPVALVRDSPIRFECEYYTTLRLPGNPPMGSVDVVVGRVVAVWIEEAVLTDGMVDLGKVAPIARCGYHQYVVVRAENLFEMVIPGDPKQLVGLEGNAERAKAFVNGEQGEGAAR